MTTPKRFLTRVIVFRVAVLVTGIAMFGQLEDIFFYNPPLNGVILAVAVFGIAFAFRQVLMLYPEVAWIERVRRDRAAGSGGKGPKLMGPMAAMLGGRGGKFRLSTMSTR